MQVRAVAPADHDELLRVYRLLFPDCDTAEADVDERANGRFPGAVFVIDRGDGRLGGFIECGWRNYAEGCDSSPVPYVEAWFVDADLRGRGLGRALVTAVEDWAREHGATELASDAEIDNTGSIAAHGRLGFEEVERTVCFRKSL